MRRNDEIEKVGSEPKQATYADLEALPNNVVGHLVEGELFALPRPAAEHTAVASMLLIRLGAPFAIGLNWPGGWRLLSEPELHLGRDVLVPDLAGWRQERLPEISGSFFSVAPDWICEVLSPSTTTFDRSRKLPIYARERVGHVWLVDPLARTLEVFRREDEGWILVGTHAEAERVRAEPFEAFELELQALWPSSPAR